MHAFITFLIFGTFFAIIIIGIIRSEQVRTGKRPPREPRTDFPPAFYDLLSGTNHDVYTAPVWAVTPSGIRVNRRRCCQSGHQSPAQAVACAERVKQRIARTGR